ncbi:MAG: hypothetical protein DMD77_02665 [Candidatus Rokuibacteriota bacterium]|nr:MAG: hypothetical protein DMD77_02665 [Candidatus Rokubacteria bacterium]
MRGLIDEIGSGSRDGEEEQSEGDEDEPASKLPLAPPPPKLPPPGLNPGPLEDDQSGAPPPRFPRSPNPAPGTDRPLPAMDTYRSHSLMSAKKIR